MSLCSTWLAGKRGSWKATGKGPSLKGKFWLELLGSQSQSNGMSHGSLP